MLNARSVAARLFVCVISICVSVGAWADTFFSGTVVDTQNQPLVGVTIVAGHQTFFFGNPFVIDGQATTDAQGQYAITTLAADNLGTYVVAARLAGYVTEIYPNLPCYAGDPLCLDLAPPGAPVAPPIAGANFQLTRAATISGHISRADTSAPVSTLLWLQRTDMNGGLISANADSEGNYTTSGLFPGTYQAETTAPYGAPDVLGQIYAGHDYDDTFPQDAMAVLGDTVSVDEGQALTGIDFALNTGAFISGMTTSALNGAFVSAPVNVRRLLPIDSGPDYVPVATSADYGMPNPGSYTSVRLAPGTIKVFFSDANAFAPQYFMGVSDESQAQEISLLGGQTTSGIDAVLTPGQTISGKVTDLASSNPLSGDLVHVGTDFALPLALASAFSDANGDYLVQGIDAGQTYTVWIDDVRGYMGAATPVTPQAGDQLTGIDIALQPGSYASGRIYDSVTGGNAVGVYAQLYDVNGAAVGGFGPTGFYDAAPSDAQGNYFSPAVPAGQYYLGVNTSLGTYLYPLVACGFNPCDFAQAQLLDMSTVQEYPNLDFVIPNLDLVFRGNFE